MLPKINIGGIVSGLNTNEIIAQLSAVARIPMQRLELQKQLLGAKMATWGNLSTKLVSFRLNTVAVGQALASGNRRVTVSDETILSASVSGSPSLGAQSLKVMKLARAEQSLSQGFRSTTSHIIGTGTLQLTAGNGTDDHDLSASTELTFINNGSGFSGGSIQITDRSGATATIDLSFADTIQDVMDAISGNTSIRVTAKISDDGTGLTIQDDTESTNGPLIIAESGGTAAASLGILTSAGGVLQNQVVGQNLNPRYSIPIDTTNNSLTGIRDAINDLHGPFTATIINDGTPGSPYRLSVVNKNTGTIGQITLSGTVNAISNELVGTGDGTRGSALGDYSLAIGSINNISDITNISVGGTSYAVRALGGRTGTGLEVEVDLADGRLQFFNNGVATNVTGEIRASYTPAGFTFTEAQTAQDAEIQIGTSNPITITSHSNTLKDAIPGLNLNLLHADPTKTVTLTVDNDVEAIVEAITNMVEDYNAIVTMIKEQNTYDSEKKSRGGPLFGDGTLLNILSSLRRGISESVPGLPSTSNSIFEIGIKPGENGTLEIDKPKLEEALVNNMEAVQAIFSNNKNIAANALFSASSSAAGFDVNSLFDGVTSPETFGPGQGWQDNTPNEFPDYINMRFQEPKHLNKLILHTVNTTAMPASSHGVREYDIQYLKLGGNPAEEADWVTIESVSGNTQGKKTHVFNVHTQEIRIKIKGSNAADGLSRLTEIELFEDNSIGARIKNEISDLTDATNGTIFFSQDSLQDSVETIDKQLERMEARIERQEAQLLRKFTEMERLLGQFQTVSNYFSSQLGSLNSNRGNSGTL